MSQPEAIAGREVSAELVNAGYGSPHESSVYDNKQIDRQEDELEEVEVSEP